MPNNKLLFTMMSADGNEIRMIFRAQNNMVVVKTLSEGEFVPHYTRYFPTLSDAMRHAVVDLEECYSQ